MIGQHPAFNAANGRGVPGLEPEFQTCGHDGLPQQITLGAVTQVNLVAQLAGPTGARHDQRNAIKLHFAQPVVAQVHDLVAKQRPHDLAGLGALQL